MAVARRSCSRISERMQNSVTRPCAKFGADCVAIARRAPELPPRSLNCHPEPAKDLAARQSALYQRRSLFEADRHGPVAVSSENTLRKDCTHPASRDPSQAQDDSLQNAASTRAFGWQSLRFGGWKRISTSLLVIGVRGRHGVPSLPSTLSKKSAPICVICGPTLFFRESIFSADASPRPPKTFTPLPNDR